ncbi:16S rRNA (guanine(966)-N(2))-methyltransferase RsmD [Psychromonas sp. MME2]|uniref:16S rRNA (guanine(966)-N(2))-methyltransferase RsmD n=1 Tax=Psychromonas sp. MME2 TaxID=3231033 RepID=UPI00339BCB89
MVNNRHNKLHEKSKKLIKSGFIRIIAGKWRGKKLPVLDKEGLRPTTDRNKETLFNWLMHDIRDTNCLDCFSGSGSLAFEALSRSAQHVTLLERDTQAASQLQVNLQTLQANNAQVIATDSLHFLNAQAQHPFDIVFIDPPFMQGLVKPCCELLTKNGYLSDNALIYIETESNLSSNQLPSHWQLIKEKSAGQVRFQLYRAYTNRNK